MKSKLIFTFFLLCTIFNNSNSLFAQIGITNGGGGGYMGVNSYNGMRFENIYVLQIDITAINFNLSNWSLMVRVANPIKNSEGKTLNPSKVSIRLNTITGNSVNIPTSQQIGVSTNPIPLSFADVPIIQNSNAPLYTSASEYSKQMKFSFDILISAGSYLEALKSWNNYTMNLLFTLRNAQGQVISLTNREFGMQIQPTGIPPIDPAVPQMGIQVNANARNGLLEFKTLNDYVNGVSQTYHNGMAITSNTPYAVQVKAINANLEAGNNKLPINSVSLTLKDPNNPNVGGTIPLSENTQTVFNASNTGTQARLFNILYFTQPNDQRMLNAKPDNYQTTLTYTLIPQ